MGRNKYIVHEDRIDAHQKRLKTEEMLIKKKKYFIKDFSKILAGQADVLLGRPFDCQAYCLYRTIRNMRKRFGLCEMCGRRQVVPYKSGRYGQYCKKCRTPGIIKKEFRHIKNPFIGLTVRQEPSEYDCFSQNHPNRPPWNI